MKNDDKSLSVSVWTALLLLLVLSGGLLPYASMAGGVALSVAIFLSMITKRPVYRAFFVSKDRLRHPFKNVPSAAVFVLLFLWTVPLTFWAIDPYSHLKGLVKWLPLLLWLFLCVQMEDPQKERIFALIPLAGAVITVAGLLSLPFPAAKSLLFLADRFCGTFQYANTCALFLSLGVIILTERLLSSLSVRNLILLAILLAGLLLTGSRSVLILLWIWGLYKCFRTKRMRLPFLILTVSVAALAFLYTAITGNLQNIGRILTVFSHQSTIWGRLLYDKDACRILLHHPFGLGFDGYKYLQPVMQTGVYTTRYVHNDLLQVMLDLGVIPGLIPVDENGEFLPEETSDTDPAKSDPAVKDADPSLPDPESVNKNGTGEKLPADTEETAEEEPVSEDELLGEPTTFPAEMVETEIVMLDKLYQYAIGQGYGFTFAIKNASGSDEKMETSKEWDVKDIRVQVDDQTPEAFHNNYNIFYLPYSGPYTVIYAPDMFLKSNLSAGEHTIKAAVQRNGTWYYGTTTVTLVDEKENSQLYVENKDNATPSKKTYFSAKKGGTISQFYFNMGLKENTGYDPNLGHHLKSVQLVKHGTTTAVANGHKLMSGCGYTDVNAHYGYKYYPYGEVDELTRNLASYMPKDRTLSVYGSFLLENNIAEGWYDIIVTTKSGAKATFSNAYYATNKTLVYGWGYRLPWWYGEVNNPNRGNYVSAYVYGVNIGDDIYPIYYNGGTAVTEAAVAKEPIISNGGYAYLLPRKVNDVWNADGSIALDLGLNTDQYTTVAADPNDYPAYTTENPVTVPCRHATFVTQWTNGSKPNCWVVYLDAAWAEGADEVGLETYISSYDVPTHTNGTKHSYPVKFSSANSCYFVTDVAASERRVAAYRIKDGVTEYSDLDTASGTNYVGSDGAVYAPDFYGYKGKVAIFDCASMEKLTEMTVGEDDHLAQKVPAADRYKFDENAVYRMFFYDEKGVITDKSYVCGMPTGTIPDSAVTVSVSPTAKTIEQGESFKVTATVLPGALADKSVSFSSSKTNVATVDATGTVTAVSPGEATITATTKFGSKKATCVVTVVEKITPVTGISLTEDDKDLEVGDLYQPEFLLTPEDTTENHVVFSSSNETVLSRIGSGFCAISEGEADIIATVHSDSANTDYTATCHVTVTKPAIPVNGISLNMRTLNLKAGSSSFLKAFLDPVDADDQEIIWKSANESIATVTEDPAGSHRAKITAKAAGQTYVTAGTAENDQILAVCVIYVAKDDAADSGDIKDEESYPNDLWITTIPAQTYSGSKIEPAVRVYDGSKELQAGVDYTLSYSNNTNKKSKDEVNPPTVTAKLKGNYSGSVTQKFTILPLEIANTENDRFDAPAVSLIYKDGKKQSPVPALTRNGKKLTVAKDFTCAYYQDSSCTGEPLPCLEGSGTYYIKVSGINNYTGSLITSCTIAENKTVVLMDQLNVKCTPTSYPYAQDGVIPVFTVKWKNQPVDSSEYEISFLNDSNKAVGKATMILTGKEDAGEDGIAYTGQKRVTFTITGTALGKAVNVSAVNDAVYTGSKISPEPVLTLKSDPGTVLTKGNDYTVSYQKNETPGTATVLITGQGQYTGTLKKTFKINKVDVNTLTYEEIGTVKYTKGGAKPLPVVRFGERVLKEGTDYTLKYSYNTALSEEGAPKKPTVTIAGKGCFTGKHDLNYQIEKQSLTNLTDISVPDKAYSTKKNAWMSTPVIKDLDGKTLKAGTDYKKPDESSYSYIGKYWGKIPEPGATITLTLEGINNYAGSRIKVSYKIFTNDIAKAVFSVRPQYFSGQEITLSQEDFTKAVIKVKDANGKQVEKDLVLGTDFEIISYESNLKKGKATVILKGIGGANSLGGTKKINVTINAKAGTQ